MTHASAEEPQLDSLADKADLEQSDLPGFFRRLQCRRHGALSRTRTSFLDAGEDAVGPSEEAVGGDEDPPDALMGPFVVVAVDPSADLLLGIEEVAELDTLDQLLLNRLVERLDLSAGLLCQIL